MDILCMLYAGRFPYITDISAIVQKGRNVRWPRRGTKYEVCHIKECRRVAHLPVLGRELACA